MRFFLLAPLAEAEAESESAAAQAVRRVTGSSDGTRARLRTNGTTLRSRIDDRASELEQSWTPVVLGEDSAPIASAWLVRERNRDFFIAFADIDELGDDAVAVETRLTGMTEDVISRTPGLAGRTVLWVNRTMLSAEDETIPGWIEGETSTLTIAGGTRPGGLEIELGWGNSRISGWGAPLVSTPDRDDDASGAIRWQLIRGMIDAQVMWCELESLSANSARMVSELAGSPSDSAPRRASRARELQRMLVASQRLFAGIAAHHLAYDDLLLNLQGPRRALAEATLEQWRYNVLLERVGRRLADLGNVLDQRRSALERRYQRLVEGVLTALSLITVVDLVLSFIALSYAETGDVVGEGSSLQVFSAIRNLSPDLLVLQTGVAVALIVALMLWLRRRA